jgi:hypothetical protein
VKKQSKQFKHNFFPKFFTFRRVLVLFLDFSEAFWDHWHLCCPKQPFPRAYGPHWQANGGIFPSFCFQIKQNFSQGVKKNVRRTYLPCVFLFHFFIGFHSVLFLIGLFRGFLGPKRPLLTQNLAQKELALLGWWFWQSKNIFPFFSLFFFFFGPKKRPKKD